MVKYREEEWHSEWKVEGTFYSTRNVSNFDWLYGCIPCAIIYKDQYLLVQMLLCMYIMHQQKQLFVKIKAYELRM